MTDIDPTEQLAKVRSAAYVVSETHTEIPIVNQFVERFGDLDQYLSDGGDLPEQWQHVTVGRPRLVEEGKVRDDIPAERHGKASTYNMGCRCRPCRNANRERATRYRNNKKERSA